jgi:hypothetical protein
MFTILCFSKLMRKMKIIIPIFFCLYLLTVLSSCSNNKIETDETLPEKDKLHIQSLGLLDKDEKILKFYSEYKNSVAGNFFTDKRIAEYWIDEHSEAKNKIQYAFYPDIISIDTVYYAGLTFSPYMRVIKRDSTDFKVSVGGKKEEIKVFFEEALALWRQKRNGK